jgi:hypothetical protein
METSIKREREVKNWSKNEYQGKSEKQVVDSCKIITWGLLVILAVLIVSMIFKF